MKPLLPNERNRCAPQIADHGFDLGQVRRARRSRGAAFGLRMLQRRWYRAAPPPARRSRPSPAPHRRAPGSAPRAARAAAARRAVRTARSGAAAAAAPDCRARSGRIWPDAGRRRRALQQQGIADVVQRRAVLPGRQRAVGGAGKILKIHEILSARRFAHVPPGGQTRLTAVGRPSPHNLQVLEKLHEQPGNTNVTEITVRRADWSHDGHRRH